MIHISIHIFFWWVVPILSSFATMSIFNQKNFICFFLFSILFFVSGSVSWCPNQFILQTDRKFEQKTDKFWEFEEQSNSWVEVELPYDLISCVNDNCTKVGSINQVPKKRRDEVEREFGERERIIRKKGTVENLNSDVGKRVSLIKMSENSVWVTGASGSIYERFWNGVQWVVAPHDLPVQAGPASSVFIVNQTILALSEAGSLYQMQLSENSQPVWVEFMPTDNQSIIKEVEQNLATQLKSGVISDDRERVYFCTMNGSLLELSEIEPPRWVNHGRPPGANVAAIADAGVVRPEVIFTISSNGDLYEYDRSSKPSWKKHIWREGTAEDTSLLPSTGFSLHGLNGAHSVSLFLLTKGGDLVERKLHQRKWKWKVHGSSEDHILSSITPILEDELNEKTLSLFLTTASGSVLEYRVPKYSGSAQDNQIPENWVSHFHPPNAKVARCVSGIQFQLGRMIFPLDDGRLGELHLSGLGGETVGPTHPVSVRRKASLKYVWSVLDAPESEGWNAEYCTEERGPTNCMVGIKDEPSDADIARSRGRKGNKAQQSYLPPGGSGSIPAVPSEEYNMPDNWINTNFRLRVMHGGRSFFLITDTGLTFEYLNAENVWLWLRHEHLTAMRGAVGHYNGSLFLVDEHGSLLIRERSNSELAWINCTGVRKGRQVIGGPPWDRLPGKTLKVTVEDALFFVSRTGRLLQFTVALRKFKWKDCRNPPNTKVASIVDQEVFRENIVFVIGRNGRLYQFNKVTELWHEHRQSQHLVLSRLPGTAMRQSSQSLTGSLFMLSEDGGLVEYHWNAMEGWNWVEHGTPHRSVTLVGSPGPCVQGNQLFLIGSDGNVYLRYLDQTTWKWKNCGFPHVERNGNEDQGQVGDNLGSEEVCTSEDFAAGFEKNEENCDPKVAPIRPIPFSEYSVIFELKDGRLAEIQLVEKTRWVWSRTIATPTSLCIVHFWTGLAS
ncbi:Large neutral amino acids transporter small subunit like [Actinidia chinensis var. chinensis]|uniref:Large neutral amino acids transporter small subunit like n=1 Tax=Actinidia chinensis var. chinensis TaxID=1590841 RepID=A0A2R6PFK3_ACTCC|nr:Large neutral amino acids transporter small subunit like [Actinidia chinensis var. chinensis]